MMTDTMKYSLLGTKGDVESLELKLLKSVTGGSSVGYPDGNAWNSAGTQPSPNTYINKTPILVSFKGKLIFMDDIHMKVSDDMGVTWTNTLDVLTRSGGKNGLAIVASEDYLHVLLYRDARTCLIYTFDDVSPDAQPITTPFVVNEAPSTQKHTMWSNSKLSYMVSAAKRCYRFINAEGEWKELAPFETSGQIAPSYMVIGGNDTVIMLSTVVHWTSSKFYYLSHDDGLTWTRTAADGVSLPGNGLGSRTKVEIKSIAGADGVLVAVGLAYGNGGTGIAVAYTSRDDGRTWTSIPVPTYTEWAAGIQIDTRSLLVYKGGFVFCGYVIVSGSPYRERDYKILRYNFGDGQWTEENVVGNADTLNIKHLLVHEGYLMGIRKYLSVYTGLAKGPKLIGTSDGTVVVDRLDWIEKELEKFGGARTQLTIEDKRSSKTAVLSFNDSKDFTVTMDGNETVLMDDDGDFRAAGDVGASIDE